jgi:Zn-dependent M28 family amino/carboxypeptidase
LRSFLLIIPETAFNIVGRKSNQTHERIAITAHIDTKIDTPGAIDNGMGVTILLLLAELLKDYGAPGQVKYIEQNVGRFGDMLLNVNIVRNSPILQMIILAWLILNGWQSVLWVLWN